LLAAAKQGRLCVRDMCSQDLKQVLVIELNAQASPWGRLSFEESLTKQSRCRVVEMIVEGGSTAIVGYHIVDQVIDELHILNVVAAPQFQGLGLGHMLMSDIIDIAQQAHCNRIFLEVRSSNEVAQSLYAKWQFKQIALRKKYYRPTSVGQPKEDAFIFMRQA
jgi:ribosomal-protein-alanine N-acetyltransferase